MSSKTGYELITEAMPLEKGRIYSFFGWQKVGKTKLALDLCLHMLREEGLKGIFICSDSAESLYESFLLFKKEEEILNYSDNKLKWMVGKNYNISEIAKALEVFNADFIIVDPVFELNSDNSQEAIFSGLKALAIEKGIIIICTAPLPAEYSVHFYPFVQFRRIMRSESPLKHLLEHSDFASVINRMSYDSFEKIVSPRPYADIIMLKGEDKFSVIHIPDFLDYLYQDGEFPEKQIEYWSV